MTDFDLPPEAVEAAAKALHAEEYDGATSEDIAAAWEANQDERIEATLRAHTAIQAFLTAMGATVDVEPRYEGKAHKSQHQRIRTPWLPVNQEG